MEARLFFAMLARGRFLEFQRKSREYFELCRVASLPHVKDETRTQVLSWYWENSLTPMEAAVRDQMTREIEEKAKSQYAHPSEALRFFAEHKAGGRR